MGRVGEICVIFPKGIGQGQDKTERFLRMTLLAGEGIVVGKHFGGIWWDLP
jgi:hypothetical protein